MRNTSYIHNLDGLRFIAASTVVVSHLETFKKGVHLPFVSNRFIENSAQLSVTFFFVLSGFLIFWWLLKETNGNLKDINLKKFYLYRFSRTWPLYFLVFLISLVIAYFNGSLSNQEVGYRMLGYLLFMPNTTGILYGMDVYLGPAWSLAVEEFFYLLFPILLIYSAKFSTGKLLIALVGIFALIAAFINPIFFAFIKEAYSPGLLLHYLSVFFERYRIYSFLIGAVFAWLYYHQSKFPVLVDGVKHPLSLRFIGGLTIVIFFLGITFSFLTHQVYSLLFGALVFVLVLRDKPSWVLESWLFKVGGKVSFGIYMLHMLLVTRLVNQGALFMNHDLNAFGILLSWTITLVGCLLVAFVVYTWYEKPLLGLIRSKKICKGIKAQTNF